MDCEFEGTLKNIVEQSSLHWIFVGGKGGVGKTTTSSSLATAIATRGRKTLIISTDPAHNLSDCFDQKVTKNPTPIQGIDNLFAMVPPAPRRKSTPKLRSPTSRATTSSTSARTRAPRTSSAKSSARCRASTKPCPSRSSSSTPPRRSSSIEKMDFEVIVFDTAPTGHTLRFLNFPSILEKGLNKLLTLKEKFNGLLQSMGNIFGSKEDLDKTMDSIFGRMERMR